MSQKQSYAIVPRWWLESLAAQGPSKPDCWSACDQCERATSNAQDAIAEPPPEQVLSDSDLAKIHEEWLGTRHNYFSLMRAIERAVLAKFTEPK